MVISPPATLFLWNRTLQTAFVYSGLLQAGNNRSCLLIDVHIIQRVEKMRHVILFFFLHSTLHPSYFNVCWLMGLCFYF